MSIIVTVTLAAIFALPAITAESFTDVQLLYINLTTDRNIYMRPQKNYDDATDVAIIFFLLHLEDIDPVRGAVSVAGYFDVEWTDENLVWTPGEYNNTEQIVLSHDQKWKPPLCNSNSVKEMKMFGQENTYVTLNYDGTAAWQPGQKLDFLCNIDTTYFPFDTHICNLSVITLGFPNGKITLSSPANTVQTNYYPPNNEWDLTETSVAVDNSGASEVKFTLHFKRRPEFLAATLILPAIAMALLNVCVFILPQESGERIGFSITLLLAVIVFLTIAQGLLASTAVPRISSICIIIMYDLFMSGMTVVSTIISALFYYKSDDEDVPNWVRIILRFCLVSRCPVSSNQVHDSRFGLKGNELKTEHSSRKLYREEYDVNITWKLVANYWDKMSFILYTLIGICWWFVVLFH